MRTTTERRSGALALCVLGLGAVLASGCKKLAPPKADLFEVTFNVKPKAGKPIPEPPAGALRPWKVWVNQEKPRQLKNPQWQPFGPKEAYPIALLPGAHWVCELQPAKIAGRYGDRKTIEAWEGSRKLRCSTDGFVRSVETLVRVVFDENGEVAVAEPPAAMYLNDIVNGEVRLTTVVLKMDPPAAGAKIPD